MKCSVVVPTCERAATLERLLAALVVQDLSPQEYEIIISDDGASEGTRAQVERWASSASVPVRYVSQGTPRQGPAAARNLGWMAARAPVIAFTDDDTIPAPDWLRQGLAALHDGAQAAAGRVVVPLGAAPTDYQFDAARLGTAGFVTANCFCRRGALEAIGGFDSRFKVAWREDSDLHFSLLDSGFTVVDAPAAVVEHPVRPARWGECLRAEHKHLYDALLLKRHPANFRRFIGHESPPLYYTIIGAALVTAVGLFARSAPVIAGGVLAWGALTGLLAARRLRSTARDPAHVAEMVITSVALPFLSVYWRVRGGIAFRTAFW